MKTLHLTLQKTPFDLMVSGKKRREYRKPSKWMFQRLHQKTYDQIKFVNGYGKDKPYFITEYKGFTRANHDSIVSFPTLNVQVEKGDYIIELGVIIEIGNLK